MQLAEAAVLQAASIVPGAVPPAPGSVATRFPRQRRVRLPGLGCWWPDSPCCQRPSTGLIENMVTENNTFIPSNIPYKGTDQNEHASQTVYFRQETAPQTIITN